MIFPFMNGKSTKAIDIATIDRGKSAVPSVDRMRLKLPAARHDKARMPREVLAAQPFIFAPPDRLICPWPKGPIDWRDEPKLLAVLAQVDAIGAALRVPVWLWPDGRAPQPVNAADPNFVARWSEGRASLVR